MHSSCYLYKLALIYELMNGHTHLSHAFIIYAFYLKLLKDRQNISGLVSPMYIGKIIELFVKLVVHRDNPMTSPIATHYRLKPFDSHDMREPCNPPEPRLSRKGE